MYTKQYYVDDLCLDWVQGPSQVPGSLVRVSYHTDLGVFFCYALVISVVEQSPQHWSGRKIATCWSHWRLNTD